MRAFTNAGCHSFNTLAVAAALLAAAVSLATVASPASAVTLANFPFTGASFVSTDAGTIWTTSDLTTGAGLPLTTNAGGTSAGTIGNPVPAAEVQYGDLENQTTSDVTLADSIALDNYYSFVVTPFSGGYIDLDEISFDIARTGGASVSASIFTSIDGFTTGDVIATYTSTLQNIMEPVTIDLSSLPNVTSATELRIYLTRATASVMTNTIFLDNIILTGTAELPPAPEPTSLALLGSGMLLLVSRRRRTTRQ